VLCEHLGRFLAQSGGEWSRVFRDGAKVKFGKPPAVLHAGAVKGFPLTGAFGPEKYIRPLRSTAFPNPNEVLNPNWNIGVALGGGFIDDINQVYLNQPSANRITFTAGRWPEGG